MRITGFSPLIIHPEGRGRTGLEPELPADSVSHDPHDFAVRQEQRHAVAKESPSALEEYYARRRAVQELIDPAGLGRIRVLAQRKDVPPAELWGFPPEGGPAMGAQENTIA